MLKGQNIVLGVCGGIAAYKAAALTSKLIQAGANVKVIMTKSATEFITPLTFQALSRHEVYTDTFIEPKASEIAHIELADWADKIVIAPATANLIAKLANGMADDMLTTTLLATKAPVYIAPAMNVNMYNHKAVQRNMTTLKDDGVIFIDADEGFLACGWVGKGRLAEPEDIVEFLEEETARNIAQHNEIYNRNILITAGPTQEQIDPARYFTNYSSGKMGYALAKAARSLGGKVTLISGPSSQTPPKGVSFISVTSAQDMLEAVQSHSQDSDIIIKSAAVADYKPIQTLQQKQKKKMSNWSIEMEKTTDILATLGNQKQEGQILVGFAAETDQVEQYARGKLEKKHLDMIVANQIGQEGTGFHSDSNEVLILTKDERQKRVSKAPKLDIAYEILNEISHYIVRNGSR
ncbi:phosphopantothenoylcysteine decarboxylase [Bacillus sp. TS-2]|nr:phosphopantothenoylcysteine decarboxylase [Bacillus sp. TS-2]